MARMRHFPRYILEGHICHKFYFTPLFCIILSLYSEISCDSYENFHEILAFLLEGTINKKMFSKSFFNFVSRQIN